MATAITEFMPYVMPEVLGCPQIMVKANIIRATRELCEKAPVWQYEHADIPTIANTRDYVMSPAANSAVANIIDLAVDGYHLTPSSTLKLREIYDDWRSESGSPLYYLRLIKTTLSLVPVPTMVMTVSLLVTLKPLTTVTTVEDFLFNDHIETIAAGAKFYLMSMPNQKWSNSGMAKYYKEQFYSGIGDASVAAIEGNVDAILSVAPCV